jgi:uncharacterized protein YcaQ
VLPVLFGDRFVARFDARLDRESCALHILSWHWETGQSWSAELADSLQVAFSHFLTFLGAGSVVTDAAVDPAVADLLAGTPFAGGPERPARPHPSDVLSG